MDLIFYKYNAGLDCGAGHCVISSQKHDRVYDSLVFLKKSGSEAVCMGQVGDACC